MTEHKIANSFLSDPAASEVGINESLVLQALQMPCGCENIGRLLLHSNVFDANLALPKGADKSPILGIGNVL